MSMESPYSPPVLYVSDDDNDDDNPTEPCKSYASSIINAINETLPHKKRKLTNTNTNILTNSSAFHWSKRQRNDSYLQQQPSSHQQATRNFFNREEPETIIIDQDETIVEDHESHSFVAFDWTNDVRHSPVAFSNPIQPIHRSTIPTKHPVVHVVKHHSDRSDVHPLVPNIHQNDRYIQSPRKKSVAFPIPTSSSPPLPLPLPMSTSAFIRPSIQRAPPVKTIRVPYATPTPSSPLIIPQRTEPSFPSAFHSTSSNSIINPPSTTEIRRQTLTGNAVLSAFYDSKHYRCNTCKFKTPNSSILLQHLFTHIFFCRQCSFYTYSQHNLYQHTFEKHNTSFSNDVVDPTKLDVLYVTRCPDGTFALCMDSSASKVTIPVPPSITNVDEQPNTSTAVVNNKKPKRKPAKKKDPKPNTKQTENIVDLSGKSDADVNNQPSKSTTELLTYTEKQVHTYVVMKHRRCFSTRHTLCLHSLTLEYNICREHTVRRMCKTQGILKRRKPLTKMNMSLFIDEVATCLKTIVNDIVNMEDNRFCHNLICKLPNNIINLVFPIDDLTIITNALKLNNKYEQNLKESERCRSENVVRTNNQHLFILSASETNQNEQSIINGLHTSITNSDSEVLKTPLQSLTISYDNTARFLKGTTKPLPPTTNSITKLSTNSDFVYTPTVKPTQLNDSSSKPPIIDRNNNSVASPKSKVPSIPSVIIID